MDNTPRLRVVFHLRLAEPCSLLWIILRLKVTGCYSCSEQEIELGKMLQDGVDFKSRRIIVNIDRKYRACFLIGGRCQDLRIRSVDLGCHSGPGTRHHLETLRNRESSKESLSFPWVMMVH